MNQNVIRSAGTVFLFWWIVLTVYGLFWGGVDASDAWSAGGNVLILSMMGLLSGLGLVWFVIWSEKKARTEMLASESVRGLICTIGEVPMIAKEPNRADELPDMASVPEIPGDFFSTWFAMYEKTHPGHVSLMRALLLIYQHYKDLPATHVAGGHGGRTLLQHSLLAGYFMDKLSKTWHYTGLRDRTGKRVVLKLRDESYVFDRQDPLIVLLGVAHDIGKIEAYIFDDDGAIVGIHHEHDLTGARMIARIPEAWEIPDEDRQAIFLALAHYHHPMELPLSPDRRAVDDRTIALMELLIKTDYVASRMEADGRVPENLDYEKTGEIPVAATDVSPGVLFQTFVEIINEHSRLNSSDPRFNVGTVCTGKGFSKAMLLLKEDSLRSALIRRLQLPTSQALGDGRHQITIDLMKAFDEKGILYRSHDGVEYSAESALWNIDFMSRSTVGGEPQKKSGWSAVIVVDPKLFPRIAQMEPYWWYAVIQRGTLGAARAVNKPKAASIVPLRQKRKGGGATSVNLLEVDEDGVEEAMTAAKSDFGVLNELLSEVGDDLDPVPQESVGNDTDLDPDSGPGPDPQQPDPDPGPLQSEDEESEFAQTMPTPGKRTKPTRVISPVDIHQGILKVIKSAETRKVSLKEIGGQYLLSCTTLAEFAPEIDWAGCRYKIQKMCASGKVEAIIFPLGDDGYGLAVNKEKYNTD